MADNDVFLTRNLQLRTGLARVRQEGAQCAAATALLAVHSAIALNDAVLIALSGARAKGQDHSKAASLTETACKDRKISVAGIKHLRALLGSKTRVSYGDEATTVDSAETLAAASERFSEWAYSVLKEVGRQR